MVRGATPPTVSPAVVLTAGWVRGGSRPSPRGYAGSPASELVGALGGPGKGRGLCLTELQSPRQGHVLARPRPGSRCALSSIPPLGLMPVPVSVSQHPQRPQQLECMAPRLRSQLQPASVSPFTLQKLIQLRSAVYPLGGGRGQGKVARPLPIMTSGPPLWVELFSKNGNCCELGTNMMGICYNMYSY